MTSISIKHESVTEQEFVGRAAALVRVLKERAPRAEQLRQMPPETVDDLISAGLVRIAAPERYGGLDLPYEVMFEVSWELGRACGSTSWCYSVWTVHNWILGHFPEQGQDEYFATGPDTLCSSAFHPVSATAEPVTGGYRLRGRWGFSSGCDAASWAMLGMPGPQGATWFLVPRTDYRIDDNWFVSGLCGTGSKEVVVEEAFVPTHRTLAADRAGVDDWTGWQLHQRPSYHVPMRTFMGWDLVSPIVGIAQGAVDELTSRLQGTSGPGRTADSIAVQLRLAEASAEVDAARLIHRHAIQHMLARGARGESFTLLDRARYQRDKAYVVRLCVQAVNRLFEAAGGHALFTSDPMQRIHRDAHAASHQAALSWDTAAENYGRLALH